MDFGSFIAACGFEPPERIEPGRIVRFSTNGKRGDDAGWALLFPDGDGGVVGDWRSGEQQIWQAEKVQTFTPEQKINWQRAIETAKREAEEQRRKDQDEVAKRAAEIWALSGPAADHPYAKRKGVSVALRVYHGDLTIGGMKCDGALLVPARRADGSMRSLQFIDAAGEKRYMPRGEIQGNFHMVGRPAGTICVAEGLATAASVAEATGHATAVAFDAGNLMPVCKALRAKYPQASIIVCADNDAGVIAGKVKNPGVTHGRAAAEAVSGRVVVPELGGEKCDWNDLHVKQGKEVVRLGVDPTPSVISVAPDDTAFLRHMVEKEGHSLCRPPAYLEEVRERLSGKFRREGALLPWAKTRGLVYFQPKQVSIWAGINGHGKSALLNQVLMDFNLQEQITWLASLEMPVAATLERMVRQAAGVLVPADDYIDAFHRWVDGRLYLHDHVGRESPKKMVAMLRYVHEKTAAKHYVIDSMMRVVRSPDDYAGQKEFIELLCSTAHDLSVHIHVVAHMRKGESEHDQSGKFDVKGASEITDLVDNVFVVWRNKLKEKKLAELSAGDPDYGQFYMKADTILTCSKQRHGDWEGDINLWYEPASKAYHGTSEKSEWSVSPKVLGIEDHVPF